MNATARNTLRIIAEEHHGHWAAWFACLCVVAEDRADVAIVRDHVRKVQANR